MNPRPRARGHEEALTIADGKGYLEGLGTIFTVANASALVKAIFACRASIPTCPRPRPERHPQPVLQPRHRAEGGQHRSVECALDGRPTDLRLPSNLADGGVPTLPQRHGEPEGEDLRVPGTDRGVRGERSRWPLAVHDVGAWLRVASGSGHVPSVGQSQDSRIVSVPRYSRNGSYRSHAYGGQGCRSIASSGVTS